MLHCGVQRLREGIFTDNRVTVSSPEAVVKQVKRAVVMIGAKKPIRVRVGAYFSWADLTAVRPVHHFVLP